MRVSFSDKPCDIQWFQVRFEEPRALGFLARSPTINFYRKMSYTFRISQGIQWRQHRRYIADITAATLRAGIDDITGFSNGNTVGSGAMKF